MGTKQDPGAYDCYAAAEPDEPLFILLARDPLAPILVELWAALRKEHGCTDHPHRDHGKKASEALTLAGEMRSWRAVRQDGAAAVTPRNPSSEANAALDAFVLAELRRAKTPPHAGALVGRAVEAGLIKRDRPGSADQHFRAVDRSLQRLRKKGRIEYSSARGGGWSLRKERP